MKTKFLIISAILFFTNVIIVNGQVRLTKAGIEADTLLSAIVKDSVFLEYAHVKKENFDAMVKSIESGEPAPKINPDDKRLNTPEAKAEIASLRKKGIENPEFTFLYAIQGARLLSMVFMKYPQLKDYPKDVITQLYLYVTQ